MTLLLSDLAAARSMAELLRSAMVELTLWWLDHPEVQRPVIVDLVTRAWRGLLTKPKGE